MNRSEFLSTTLGIIALSNISMKPSKNYDPLILIGKGKPQLVGSTFSMLPEVKVAGVDKQLVKEAAIAYATAKNSMEFHGLGVTEQEQGSKTVMLIADLAMITGNIGRKGVGVNPLRGQNNVQGAADMGCQPHQGAGYFEVSDEKNQKFYTEKYGVTHPTKPGLKIPQMFEAAIDKELKGLWIIGEDIVQTDPNSAHVIEAMNSLELLVVQEIFMSETAKLV